MRHHLGIDESARALLQIELILGEFEIHRCLPVAFRRALKMSRADCAANLAAAKCPIRPNVLTKNSKLRVARLRWTPTMR